MICQISLVEQWADLVICFNRYLLRVLKNHGLFFEEKMAVQDVCEIHVRIGHARFLSGKSKTEGYSAHTMVSLLQ